MRKFLIRLLFKLINKNEDYASINDDVIKQWLVGVSDVPGFREYVRKRDLHILKMFGTGMSRDKMLVYMGQRLELFKMLEEAKKAKKEEEKKKEKQLKRSKNKDK